MMGALLLLVVFSAEPSAEQVKLLKVFREEFVPIAPPSIQKGHRVHGHGPRKTGLDDCGSGARRLHDASSRRFDSVLVPRCRIR